MTKGNFLNETPVWNTLERNQRIHARSGLTTLRDCLTHYASSHSGPFRANEILFDLPNIAVHDARLTLRASHVGFSVTHGKHKRFNIEITDTRDVLPPRTVDGVHELVNAWEDCIKTNTNLISEQEFTKQNRVSVHPAVCAACRYDSNWQQVTVRVDRIQRAAWVDVKTGSMKIQRFTSHQDDCYENYGTLSQNLLEALLGNRPYIALCGAYFHRKSVSIKFGHRHGITINNDFATMEMLRVVSEAYERDWYLQES